MASTLDNVAALSDQKQKIEQYKVALTQVLGSGNADDCKTFVMHSKSYYACKCKRTTLLHLGRRWDLHHIRSVAKLERGIPLICRSESC